MLKTGQKLKLIELLLRIHLDRCDTKPIYWCWVDVNVIEYYDKHILKKIHLVDLISSVVGIM